MSIADTLLTKNATIYGDGLNELTRDGIASALPGSKVEEFNATPGAPRHFAVRVGSDSFRLFVHDDPQVLEETMRGFHGWVDMVHEDGDPAEIAPLHQYIDSINKMYGVIADEEFSMKSPIYDALEQLTAKIEGTLFIHDSIISCDGNILYGKLLEIALALEPKPWWKFWG